MKVFLDEDVPRKLLPFLAGHNVETVASMNWGGVKNGALLALIEREGFEVLLTGDKNMQAQQDLEGRPFAVLILSAINWPVIRPNVQAICSAIDNARTGTVTPVNCGTFASHAKRTAD